MLKPNINRCVSINSKIRGNSKVFSKLSKFACFEINTKITHLFSHISAVGFASLAKQPVQGCLKRRARVRLTAFTPAYGTQTEQMNTRV